MDAAYVSAKSKKWEPILLDIWRGRQEVESEDLLVSYDDAHWLIKEEETHFGTKKIILKEKSSGRIFERTI